MASPIRSLRTCARSYLPKSLVGMLRGRTEAIRFLVGPRPWLRWRMLGRFQLISCSVECTQSEPETLLAAPGILALGRDVPGVIVECGCYKGGSTAKLSIVAKTSGRRLVVFDSFAGLPAEDGRSVSQYYNLLDGVPVEFRQGLYHAELEEVRDNVSRWGEGDIVE